MVLAGGFCLWFCGLWELPCWVCFLWGWYNIVSAGGLVAFRGFGTVLGLWVHGCCLGWFPGD